MTWFLKARTRFLLLARKRKEIDEGIFEKDPGQLKEKVEEKMRVFKASYRVQCLRPQGRTRNYLFLSKIQGRVIDIRSWCTWCQKKQSLVQG